MGAEQELASGPLDSEVAALSASMSHIGDWGKKAIGTIDSVFISDGDSFVHRGFFGINFDFFKY